jgi:hypothetical protein
MHVAVDFDRDAQFANCKVDCVATDLVLPHDVHAFAPQRTQHTPRAFFGSAHAVASLGARKARRMSQAPAPIIGRESSMPMVT